MTDTVVVESDTDDAPPADDSPDVVVVDTGDDGGSDNDLEIGVSLGALAATVAQQGEAINSLTARMDMAEMNAEYAFEMASTAQDTAIDAVIAAEEAEEVAEDAADDVEEVIEPDREHRLWRKPIRIGRHDHD